MKRGYCLLLLVNKLFAKYSDNLCLIDITFGTQEHIKGLNQGFNSCKNVTVVFKAYILT